MKAEKLDSVMYRMGLLAVLRSKAKSGQAIGVMVTASHNPVQDNGVKLVDPMGEMLEQSWEAHATALANSDDDNLVPCLQNIVKVAEIDESMSAKVVLGMDTRPSSVALVAAVKDGVEAAGGVVEDFGLLTTPQLHYMVCCINTNGEYGEATEDGYYKKLSSAFISVSNLAGASQTCSLKIDGANGVGAPKVKKLLEYLGDSLKAEVFNDGSSGELNKGCGADYVKVQQSAPAGMVINAGERCLSFDGDADRIVYFFADEEGKFVLLDGDKIATLIAGYIKKKLDDAGVILSKGLGVVQTAYANGSSTRYINDQLKVPAAITKTGVKHLHHKALDFDIGVYFEANGHGTVIYNEEAQKRIREASSKNHDNESLKKAASTLEAFMDLTNQTVGDAISDMLLVEAILNEYNWSAEDWNKQYTDLPNRQLKVSVADRTVIQPNHNETRVLAPEKLQAEIDKLVETWSQARSFVRPSGTEDVVRVYAESENKKITEHLAGAVSALVYDICGGVGTRPDVPPLLTEK